MGLTTKMLPSSASLWSLCWWEWWSVGASLCGGGKGSCSCRECPGMGVKVATNGLNGNCTEVCSIGGAGIQCSSEPGGDRHEGVVAAGVQCGVN